MGVLPKRLSYAYHYDGRLQGSIHCEILVFERGSWVALPIYRIESHTVDRGTKTILSGFIESTSNRRFRVILSYTKGNSRPSHWLLDHDILCGLHLDGRARPISEHAIRQGTFENSTDLAATSEASELAALHPHIPKEQDQPFCWQPRSDKYSQLVNLPKCATSTDELSSIKLEVSRCKLQKIKRGVSVFPSSVPRDMSSRADRQFEVLRKKHADLSHEIIVDDTPEDKVSKKEVVSDFEYTSDPFVEFKLFYKEGPTLERLGIKPTNALPSRTRSAGRGVTAAPVAKSVTPAWLPKGPSTVAEQRAALSRMEEALGMSAIAPKASARSQNPYVTPMKRPAPSADIKLPKAVSFAPSSPTRSRAMPCAEPAKPMADKPKKLADGQRVSASSSVFRVVASSEGSSSSTKPSKRPRVQDSNKVEKPGARQIEGGRPQPTGVSKSMAIANFRNRMREHGKSALVPKEPPPPTSAQADSAAKALSSHNNRPTQAPPTPPSMPSDCEDHAVPDIDSDNESLPSISELFRGHTSTTRHSQASVSSTRPTLKPGQVSRTPAQIPERTPISSRPPLAPENRKAVCAATKTDVDTSSNRPLAQVNSHTEAAVPATTPIEAVRSHPYSVTEPTKVVSNMRLHMALLEPAIEKKPHIPPTPKSIQSKPGKPPLTIDLTLDSDQEEEEKKMVQKAISTPTAAINGGTGIERNARARQEAKDFLDSLGILDDMNVEDLLQAGFKSRNTFAPRLKCCAEEDRNALLSDLRQSMGRIDFSILAGFLKGQGIEC